MFCVAVARLGKFFLMEVLAEIVSPQVDDMETKDADQSSARNERMLERCKVFLSFLSLFLSQILFLKKSIPMRLTEEERVLLNILENALDVSEYTDTVDVFARKPKSDRIISGLVDILSISSGLMVSNNLNKGEGLMKTNSLGMSSISTSL
jgi:hypothetical protein